MPTRNGSTTASPPSVLVNPSGAVEFNTTWGFGANYSQPLGFLPVWLPLTYKALVGMHGPKGFGENRIVAAGDRRTELFTQQTLDLDTGKIFRNKANMWSVWVGWRYWHNKFGINDTNIVRAPAVGSDVRHRTHMARRFDLGLVGM